MALDLVLYLAQPHKGKSPQTTAPKHAKRKTLPKAGRTERNLPTRVPHTPPSQNPSERRSCGDRLPEGLSFARPRSGDERTHTYTHTSTNDGRRCSTSDTRRPSRVRAEGVALSLLRQGPQGLQVGREEQHQGTRGRERKPGPDPGHDEGSVGARTRGRSFAFGWRPLLRCDGAGLFSFRHDLRRGVGVESGDTRG